MKISELWNDSDTRPFRFALVFAVIIISMLISKKSDGQEISNGFSSWTTSFDEAIEQAKEFDAPIMLFFHGSDWCPWSKKLTHEVFSDNEFPAWMESKLIPVNVDFPKKTQLPPVLLRQNNLLLSRYRPHLTGFPTVLFVNSDGTVIGKLGYVEGGLRAWTNKAQSIVGKLDKLARFDRESTTFH